MCILKLNIESLIWREMRSMEQLRVKNYNQPDAELVIDRYVHI